MRRSGSCISKLLLIVPRLPRTVHDRLTSDVRAVDVDDDVFHFEEYRTGQHIHFRCSRAFQYIVFVRRFDYKSVWRQTFRVSFADRLFVVTKTSVRLGRRRYYLIDSTIDVFRPHVRAEGEHGDSPDVHHRKRRLIARRPDFGSAETFTETPSPNPADGRAFYAPWNCRRNVKRSTAIRAIGVGWKINKNYENDKSEWLGSRVHRRVDYVGGKRPGKIGEN